MTAPFTLEDLKAALADRSVRVRRAALARIPELSVEDLAVLNDGAGLTSTGMVRVPYRSWARKNLPQSQIGDASMCAMRAGGLLDGRSYIGLINGPQITDLSWLDGLALTEVYLSAQSRLSHLGPLASLVGLIELTIRSAHKVKDLSPLAGLEGLKKLTLSEARALRDLTPLAGAAALEALTLDGSRGHLDLSGLSGLPALKTLHLGAITESGALAPLAGLPRLEHLKLDACGPEVDLAPLARIPGLRVLDLGDCPGVDLSPLAGATGLRALRWDAPPADLAPLRGMSGLVADVRPSADEQGVTGLYMPLRALIAAHVDGEHLATARALDLSGQTERFRLDWLARCPDLRSLNLKGCVGLEDTWPLIGAAALETLDLEGADVAPRPRRRMLEGREAVEGYRRQIARALSQQGERSPREERWLAEAQRLGLLEAKAPVSREDRSREAQLKTIRRLISGDDDDTIRQGYALLEALEDPAAIAELATGVSLDGRGQAALTSGAKRRAHLRRRRTQAWAAMKLLRLSGQLDGARALKLPAAALALGASPIAGLPELARLEMPLGALDDDALTALVASLPGLQTLAFGHPEGDRRRLPAPEVLAGWPPLALEITWWYAADLSPLGAFGAMTSLRLSASGQAFALVSLETCHDLQALELEGLSELSGLSSAPPALDSLTLRRWKGASLPPSIADAGWLRALHLSDADRLVGLLILQGHPALRSLRLEACERLESLPEIPGLEALAVRRCWRARLRRGLKAAAGLRSLELDVRGYDGPPLIGFQALERLALGRGLRVPDLTALAPLTNLRALELEGGCGADLSGLSAWPELRALRLLGATAAADLAPLAGLERLTSLALCLGEGGVDLAPLAGLAALEHLELRRGAIRDLAPLRGLPKLASLTLSPSGGAEGAPAGTWRGDALRALLEG